MSDLVGNHIVGFPTKRLKLTLSEFRLRDVVLLYPKSTFSPDDAAITSLIVIVYAPARRLL